MCHIAQVKGGAAVLSVKRLRPLGKGLGGGFGGDWVGLREKAEYRMHGLTN